MIPRSCWHIRNEPDIT